MIWGPKIGAKSLSQVNLWFKGGGISCPECVVLRDRYSTMIKALKIKSWEARFRERIPNKLPLMFRHVALSVGESPPPMEQS